MLEALGHCGLILFYAITLVLRNEDESQWSGEWFPRDGYGWVICVIFVIILPSPSIIFYCLERRAASRDSDGFGDNEQINPISIVLETDVKEDSQTSLRAARLAQMQREN